MTNSWVRPAIYSLAVKLSNNTRSTFQQRRRRAKRWNICM